MCEKVKCKTWIISTEDKVKGWQKKMDLSHVHCIEPIILIMMLGSVMDPLPPQLLFLHSAFLSYFHNEATVPFGWFFLTSFLASFPSHHSCSYWMLHFLSSQNMAKKLVFKFIDKRLRHCINCDSLLDFFSIHAMHNILLKSHICS